MPQAARRKCDELLRLATRTTSPGARSELISQAVYWNAKAEELQRARDSANAKAIIPFRDDPLDGAARVL